MMSKTNIHRAATVAAFMALALVCSSCLDVGDDSDTPPFCIHSTLPDDGEENVPLNYPAIVVTFETDVDPASVTDSRLVVRDSSGAVVDGDVSASGVTAEFRLPSKVYFSPMTTYTVTVKGDITDIRGRPLSRCMNGDYEFTFTTGTEMSD